MNSDWIDISVPLRSGMVHWPDDPPVRIERARDMGRGDTYNFSTISMGAHSGTHMDSPLHFFSSGDSFERMPPEATIGIARVIEIRDPESIKPNELAGYDVQPAERILFKTMNSLRCWKSDEFIEDFVYISREAASYLASRRVRLVGVDYLSVGGFKADGVETHRELLGAGIWILEGLDLSQVEPGRYELICLPLRIARGDGAPARAIVRRVDGWRHR